MSTPVTDVKASAPDVEAGTLPPIVTRLDTAALRRRLAGLADPHGKPGAIAPVALKEMAHRFGSVLAHLFGDDLDRLTLWDRIGSAWTTAGAKVADDDTDRYVSLCLEHVKADAGKAAACAPLAALIQTLGSASPEDRRLFLDYLNTHRYAALIHSRARWETVKSKEIEL